MVAGGANCVASGMVGRLIRCLTPLEEQTARIAASLHYAIETLGLRSLKIIASSRK